MQSEESEQMSILNEFDEKANELQKNFEEEDKKLYNFFYHYRGVDSSQDIVKHKKLFFADYKYLQNEDSEEINLGMKAILKLIDNRSERECDWWYHLSRKFSILQELHSVYVCSFCATEDNDYLWKNYGKDGEGVITAFDFKEGNLKNTIPENVFYTAKVFYCEEGKEESEGFNERINGFLDLAGKYLVEDTIDKEELHEAIAVHLLLYVPTLKRNLFKDEKEVRLIMPGFYHSIESFKGFLPYAFTTAYLTRMPCLLPRNRFRAIKGVYDSHFIQNFEANELKEIILGKSVTEEQEKVFRDLIQNDEYQSIENPPIIKRQSSASTQPFS